MQHSLIREGRRYLINMQLYLRDALRKETRAELEHETQICVNRYCGDEWMNITSKQTLHMFHPETLTFSANKKMAQYKYSVSCQQKYRM